MSKRSGIPCASASDCPNELTCDTDRDLCVDPDAQTPHNCSATPLPGCACKGGDPAITCLADLPDGIVAACRFGESTCQSGVYGDCVLTDSPSCNGVNVGSGGFDPNPDNSEQVTTGPEGELILDPDVKQIEFGFLWVANTGENTVSKLDIETGKEVARYSVVRDSANLGLTPVPSPGALNCPRSGNNCAQADNCGNCPSRTAIDFNGDAFVANRAFTRQGSVTKYANAIEDCIDRNGNNLIDTSSDINADGIIDINDTSEFLGEDDECILWTVAVGGIDGLPRALAVDAGGPGGPNGNIWVGLYSERRIMQLAGDTGAILRTIQLEQAGNSIRPYGAAVDGNSNVWVTSVHDPYLAQVDTATGQLVALHAVPEDNPQNSCIKGYGISIDVDQRVWLGGWECQDIKAFDQTRMSWLQADLNLANTRGVAVDTSGNVWVALTDGNVARLTVDQVIQQGSAAQPIIYDLPQIASNSGAVTATIGVGIDRNGACWGVSRNDNSPLGTATRIQPDGTMESFPVGHLPYTYSDFTGFGLATVVRPNGFWRGAIEGCTQGDGTTAWKQLSWDEVQPQGTSVRMRVRSADSLGGLAQAVWHGPFDTPPVDLETAGVSASKYLEVEVQLSTDDPEVTPRFKGFSVQFDCDNDDVVVD